MKLIIDTEKKTLVKETTGGEKKMPLYSNEAFDEINAQWLKVGWNQKYTYTFTWLGRPVIQLPEDMLRIQEIIYAVRPDVILETGVAHGGSLIFYATLCKALGQGRVIGVDIEIRPHNRTAIESHILAPLITLIEGDSTGPDIVAKVRASIGPGERVLVILDSCHTRAHVTAELEAYHPLVPAGSYIIATDGIMKTLGDVPRGKPEWATDNPAAAAADFAAKHPEFVLERPPNPFNESGLSAGATYWPDAYLKRVK